MLYAPSLTVRAPCKLILSGEHSVVYGAPAVAVAIDRYTEVTAKMIQQPLIRLKSFELGYACSYTLQALKEIKQQLHGNYQRFLSGKCTIKEVLSMPFELLEFSVTNLIDKLNIQIPKGLQLEVGSKIPLGCGMGSSAALVVATLHATLKFLHIDIDPTKFLSISKESENLQHGRSSGLDIYITKYGGACRFQGGKFNRVEHGYNHDNMFFINTGTPITSTGQCVSAVADKFRDDRLVEEFSAVTNHMQDALAANNEEELKTAVTENHNLLSSIGVVPANIKDMIAEINRNNGAAKVCGAGAVAGNNAGAILVVGDRDAMEYVAKEHGYQLETFSIDGNGAYVI